MGGGFHWLPHTAVALHSPHISFPEVSQPSKNGFLAGTKDWLLRWIQGGSLAQTSLSWGYKMRCLKTVLFFSSKPCNRLKSHLTHWKQTPLVITLGLATLWSVAQSVLLLTNFMLCLYCSNTINNDVICSCPTEISFNHSLLILTITSDASKEPTAENTWWKLRSFAANKWQSLSSMLWSWLFILLSMHSQKHKYRRMLFLLLFTHCSNSSNFPFMLQMTSPWSDNSPLYFFSFSSNSWRLFSSNSCICSLSCWDLNRSKRN